MMDISVGIHQYHSLQPLTSKSFGETKNIQKIISIKKSASTHSNQTDVKSLPEIQY